MRILSQLFSLMITKTGLILETSTFDFHLKKKQPKKKGSIENDILQKFHLQMELDRLGNTFHVNGLDSMIT